MWNKTNKGKQKEVILIWGSLDRVSAVSIGTMVLFWRHCCLFYSQGRSLVYRSRFWIFTVKNFRYRVNEFYIYIGFYIDKWFFTTYVLKYWTTWQNYSYFQSRDPTRYPKTNFEANQEREWESEGGGSGVEIKTVVTWMIQIVFT